ncbi:MAG: autotransporter domain-containing protein, partial [Methyloceanibacter sp.]
GQNYAVGGATIGSFPWGNSASSLFPPSATSSNFLSVGLETVQYELGVIPPTIDLPGIQTQIDCFRGDCPSNLPGFAAGGRFKPSAVVSLFGGGNDFFAFLDRKIVTFGRLSDPTLDEVPAEVAYVTGNIKSSIRDLAAAGAKTILVPNIPNIGILPAYLGKPLAGVATALADQTAVALNAQLGKVARQTNTNIFVVDFATAVDYVRSNPASFGFTNVTEACVQPKTMGVPASWDPGVVCAHPNQYLFWDDVHPTAAAHQILAEYAADTLLAPQTIGAQADFALTNGDNFLRRMQEAILGTGVSDRGSPMLTGSKQLTPTPEWGNVFFNVRRADGEGSATAAAVGFDSKVTEASGGVVIRPWRNVALGLMGGIDEGTANLDQARGSIDLQSYHVGAMGGYDNGALFAAAGASFSHDDYDLFRQTFVPQLQSTADTSGNPFGAFGSAGYRFNWGRVTAGPLFALRYTNVQIDQYHESGAPGLDMIVESQEAEQLIGSAGIAAAVEYAVGLMTVVPYFNLTLEQDFISDDRVIRTALVTVPDVGRRLQIGNDNDVYGRLNGGIALAVAPGLIGTLSGETTISRSAGNEQAVMGTVSGRF